MAVTSKIKIPIEFYTVHHAVLEQEELVRAAGYTGANVKVRAMIGLMKERKGLLYAWKASDEGGRLTLELLSKFARLKQLLPGAP